jgi:Taurine catabolism dioxygenase TauD, TfdA family
MLEVGNGVEGALHIEGRPQVVEVSVDGPLPSSREIVWSDRVEEIEKALGVDGAVMLSGAGISSHEEFGRILKETVPVSMSYAGGNSPRTAVADGIYTSTEYSASEEITLHNELSYSRSWPKRLFFWCSHPASAGGATSLADGRRVVKRLPRDLVAEFTERKLRYVHVMHGGRGFGRSWQQVFETDDRVIAEERIHTIAAGWEWRNGSLRVEYHSQATMHHYMTGELVWFNQADQWHFSNLDEGARKDLAMLIAPSDFPHQVTFGDGGEIPAEQLDVIRAALAAEKYAAPWAAGNLLIIDNEMSMHGREPYTGNRAVYVAMG